MNKILKICMVAALVVAVATPALAEFKFNGYFRTMMYSGQFKSAADSDGDSQQWTAQRFRAKLTYSLNENVAVVYYGEVDTDWGVGEGLGTGGDRGADKTNVETKNVYLDTKFGDTAVRLGVQGLADGFDGIVFNDDMAGVSASHTIGNTKLAGFVSKWEEGASKSDWDGTDFYGVSVEQKFTDNLKGSFNIYYLDDSNADDDYTDLSTAEVFYFGPRVAFVADNFSVDGFLVFQDGEVEYDDSLALVEEDYDIEGFVGSLKGTLKIDGGDLNLRFIYGSEADDDKAEGAWTGDVGSYAFVGENQMLMLIDPYVTDWTKEQYAVNDALKAGYGLMAFVVSGNHSLPSDMYVKWGVGYYLAVDEERYDTDEVEPVGYVDSELNDRRKGDTIGYEVAARVGKKVLEKVDISLNAAYASFGDFYDNSSYDDDGTADDPDDIYKAYLMVNVPF